ncbi:TenA family protein [Glaciihabitans sp. dw_435]|uniref:TenA family protein n=1 Tax=Glaciihabitans sp. dw_435 TaxID=2720081 RepID=UPI001BD466E5|nr:hypothetical protein [Glaciihabitans sp. dw_435]
MTDAPSLAATLTAYGQPRYEAWAQMPFLRGIQSGTLPVEVFRYYLEQNYLYLKHYARLYSRLAYLAPDGDVEHFIALASGVVTVELDNHRRLGEGFDCNFDEIVPSPELAGYMGFLSEMSADMGEALVSMLPCVAGYGVAVRMLTREGAGPYAGWIGAYTSGEYQDVIDRHLALIDHFAVDLDRATQIMDRALDFEDAFWNVQPPPSQRP